MDEFSNPCPSPGAKFCPPESANLTDIILRALYSYASPLQSVVDHHCFRALISSSFFTCHRGTCALFHYWGAFLFIRSSCLLAVPVEAPEGTISSCDRVEDPFLNHIGHHCPSGINNRHQLRDIAGIPPQRSTEPRTRHFHCFRILRNKDNARDCIIK